LLTNDRDCRGFRSGTIIARGYVMPRSSSFASSLLADDELFVLAKDTRRLEPLFLVSALHANDDASDDNDATLAVSPADNMRILAHAFHPDDEITVDAPAPELPAGTPSPLGDDLGDDESAGSGEPVSGARRRPAVPDLMSELTHASTPVAKPVSSKPPIKYDAVPDLPLLTSHVQRGISGVRHSISPDAVQAARAGREATRLARRVEARTRMIVLGIWGMAVILAALLAFVATST